MFRKTLYIPSNSLGKVTIFLTYRRTKLYYLDSNMEFLLPMSENSICKANNSNDAFIPPGSRNSENSPWERGTPAGEKAILDHLSC